MRPTQCHVNFKPIKALFDNPIDFDLFELEKMNFGFKLEKTQSQASQEEVRTPTFPSDRKLNNAICLTPMKPIFQSKTLVRSQRKRRFSIEGSPSNQTTKFTQNE